MDPIVNLQEKPGKVVGRIRRRPPAQTLDWLVAQFHAMGLKLPYPKGVYRFKTFEEANAWTGTTLVNSPSGIRSVTAGRRVSTAFCPSKEKGVPGVSRPPRSAFSRRL